MRMNARINHRNALTPPRESTRPDLFQPRQPHLAKFSLAAQIPSPARLKSARAVSNSLQTNLPKQEKSLIIFGFCAWLWLQPLAAKPTPFQDAIVLVDEEGRNFLHYGARFGNAAAIKQTLAAGLPVDGRDEEGRTALHHLSERVVFEQPTMTEFVTLLVKAGASVNAPDTNQRTPLHHAARRLNPELVVELLKQGANVQALDHRGRSALHLLSSTSYSRPEHITEVALPLMNAGANPELRDGQGYTPRDLAVMRRDWDFLNGLATAERQQDN
jgi:ankyrin repeat protein